MLFYLGTHILSHAIHFERVCISINLLWRYDKNGILHRRVSDFQANTWIMDSGAFTEVSTYGQFRHSVKDYAKQINRWAKCGKLELAVSQDYMCEPHKHQQLTIERYDQLIKLTSMPILPVLQGYEPSDYTNHILMYGDRLQLNMRVGVGSICKRNTNITTIVNILEAIKEIRPDLRLHGFGLKITALRDAYISSMLYSADSMAWSLGARRQGKDRNGLKEALDFLNDISSKNGKKEHQLILVR